MQHNISAELAQLLAAHDGQTRSLHPQALLPAQTIDDGTGVDVENEEPAPDSDEEPTLQ